MCDSLYSPHEDVEPQQEVGVPGGREELVVAINSNVITNDDHVFPPLLKVTFGDGKVVV